MKPNLHHMRHIFRATNAKRTYFVTASSAKGAEERLFLFTHLRPYLVTRCSAADETKVLKKMIKQGREIISADEVKV